MALIVNTIANNFFLNLVLNWVVCGVKIILYFVEQGANFALQTGLNVALQSERKIKNYF